ncbi:MAG: carbamate kinase [Actinobacteria bacterium]|nr:carbamate kinase [Actinomycetota bacterium]
MTLVIALGGNAIVRAGERGTAAEQLAALRDTFAVLAPLVREGAVVITHGNGPQVGNELLRQERAADEVPPLPLWLAVAQTQGEIGALIESELAPVAERAVVCLLTHVRVDAGDTAFEEPTKPIGPFYGDDQAKTLERERGWQLVEDAGRGFRRVVPSPAPLEIVEVDAIRALVASGAIAVACGGGGIPVTSRNGKLKGIDAVIDKDRASALLARQLGATRLLILTEVPAVYRAFGTESAEELRELTAEQAAGLLPELPPGSMRPKVEAAIDLARAGGETLITSMEALTDALAGRAGTRVSR